MKTLLTSFQNPLSVHFWWNSLLRINTLEPIFSVKSYFWFIIKDKYNHSGCFLEIFLSSSVLRTSTTVVFVYWWELTTERMFQFYDSQPHTKQVPHAAWKKWISRACHHLWSSQRNHEKSFQLSQWTLGPYPSWLPILISQAYFTQHRF